MEQVPWADGKHTLTHEYAKYLSDWVKYLSWTAVAKRFRTSWQTVYRSISMIIAYGLANRSIKGVEALGIDEVQYQNGHTYMTLVYQIDKGARRLLWVGKDRTKSALSKFYAKTLS
ncbi:MAG: transposase [Lentisphaerales bacterium]|nr:transposase [Lentisphaerales bacterium]